MSEYIEIEADWDVESTSIYLQTNLPLSEVSGGEDYPSPSAMATGSPVAQMLADLDGIMAARIDNDELTLRLAEAADWHVVVADVTAALKDFFL